MASSEEKEKPIKKKKLKLYSDWMSSCSWRVRIVLNLKALEYNYEGVDLLKGDQFSPEFMKLNPLSYVPVLVDDDFVIVDSSAIIHYLEDKYPQPSLLPQLDHLQQRSLNYQVANMVASNIQPFQNYAVLNYIEEKLGSEEKICWAMHHIKKGFGALEKLLEQHSGKYAVGDEIGLADVYLAPQIDGAIKRFKIDMSEFPVLNRLNSFYAHISAFQDAVPEKQPDAPNVYSLRP